MMCFWYNILTIKFNEKRTTLSLFYLNYNFLYLLVREKNFFHLKIIINVQSISITFTVPFWKILKLWIIYVCLNKKLLLTSQHGLMHVQKPAN